MPYLVSEDEREQTGGVPDVTLAHDAEDRSAP